VTYGGLISIGHAASPKDIIRRCLIISLASPVFTKDSITRREDIALQQSAIATASRLPASGPAECPYCLAAVLGATSRGSFRSEPRVQYLPYGLYIYFGVYQSTVKPYRDEVTVLLWSNNSIT
jgi:hypothetical protein